MNTFTLYPMYKQTRSFFLKQFTPAGRQQQNTKEVKLDKKELVKKMKQGEIGFIDEPEEEKEVWQAYEKLAGTNIEKRKKELQDIAKATIENNKRISIRVNERDLFELKAKALENGVPYQNLIGALIHHYVTDKISLTI